MIEDIIPTPIRPQAWTRYFILKLYWPSLLFRRHHDRPCQHTHIIHDWSTGKNILAQQTAHMPINTGIPALLTRPSTHTPQETEDITFTRPSMPTQRPGVIQSRDNKQAGYLPNCPITKTTAKPISIALIPDHPPALVTPFKIHI